VVAFIVNFITYSSEVRNHGQWTLNMKSGAMVAISNIAYSYAIKFTNFPVVMMVRSCNILSVVLVGVLFTGVKDATLKIGKRKIIIAAIASAGMIIFKVFDPNSANNTYTAETLGVILIIVSLIADGFLPDYQAMIKSIYKPPPLVMMEFVNKWAFLLCLAFSVCMGHIIPMVTFILAHQSLLIDLFLLGFLCSFGQFFVYYLAMVFRQHVVPLIVGTRKIFTVGLSIIYYDHSISPMQLIGLLTVFCISLFEFKVESAATKTNEVKKPKEQ
jgi:UDP-galactose transporter B1